MRGKTGILCCLFLVFYGIGFLFPADRYALVIGNGNYKDKSIPNLTNPVNDAADVASSLKTLGYNVTLKTNVGLRELQNAIVDFSGSLSRSGDSEGFFWFAGHGISVKGIHYLLPTDADPTDDFSIPRTSFSVDDLMEQIENARNKTNLIVIDACRNNLAQGGRAIGSRGLTVLSQDDYRIKGNKIVYSTMAGKTASDGASGSRNSPFAQAFLDNMQEHEIFDDVFLDIANETLRLTKGDQEPYSMGTFAVKSYSLNPQETGPVAQAGSSATAPPSESTGGSTVVSPKPLPVQPNTGKKNQESAGDARLWSIGASLGTSFADPYFIGTIRGTIAPFNYSFLELGLDIGTLSGDKDVESSYSIYPFVHYAYFRPVNDFAGFYAGAGFGYMRAEYTFTGISASTGTGFFAVDMVIGAIFFNMLDVSYTLRTNFSRAANKLSVGYTYRFK